MSQILYQDNTPPLVRASDTTVTWANTYLGNPTRVTLGGQQYTTSALTLDMTTNGAGGLDIGAVAASSTYYVYTVLDSGSLALIVSLATPSFGPAGYTSWTTLGSFSTDSASNIATVLQVGDELATATSAGTVTSVTDDIVLADANTVGLQAHTTPQTLISVTDGNFINVRSVAVAYSDINGVWRMKFNVLGTMPSAASGITIQFAGTLFSTAYAQSISFALTEDGVANRTPTFGETSVVNGQIFMTGSGNFNRVRVSGDVELAGKPTWA